MAKFKKTVDKNTASETPAQNIGIRLKTARERKDLSISDVFKVIKIYPATLEELENGRLENKLGATYTKAFLKNYSDFLGLDTDEILKEYGGKKYSSEENFGAGRNSAKTAAWGDFKLPSAFSGGINKNSQYASQGLGQPLDRAPKAKDELNKSAPQKINIEFIRAIFSIVISLVVFAFLIFGVIKTGQYIKSVSSAATKTGPAMVKRADVAHVEAEQVTSTVIPVPRQKFLTLTLNASSDVWLKVAVDGKVVFHKTLSKKSKETWKAEKEIRLAEIGKPEALKMVVNGKDIDFSKKPPRSILITHEGVVLEPK